MFHVKHWSQYKRGGQWDICLIRSCFFLFLVVSIQHICLKYPERVENQFIFGSKTSPTGISAIYEADDRRVQDITPTVNNTKNSWNHTNLMIWFLYTNTIHPITIDQITNISRFHNSRTLITKIPVIYKLWSRREAYIQSVDSK